MNLIVKVVRSKYRRGWALEHNQPSGFKGIIGHQWAWFKEKAEAEKSAQELMKCWNSKAEYTTGI
jgi:hypothetical protein